MLIFLILTVQSSQPSSFLTLSPDDEITLKLAEGLETTDNSLQSLLSSLSSLNLKIDNSLLATSSSLSALIDSEISSKKQLLSTLNSEIHSLLRNSNNIYQKCSGFRTCEACSFNPLCIWCEIEQLCVGGDQDGPFHGECSYFSYQGCYTNGCKSHTRCSTCVQSQQCGWCVSSNECLETSDSCEGLPFIRFDVSEEVCPEYDDVEVDLPEVYLSFNPTGSEDLADVESTRRIGELREQSSRVLQDIQELQYVKAKMISQVEQSIAIKSGDGEKDVDEGIVKEIRKVIDLKNSVGQEAIMIDRA